MVEDPYKDLKISVGAVVKPCTTLANKTGSWREFKPVIDHERCVACGNCEKYCPDMAIKEVEEGRFEIDLDYCKGCEICAEECPIDAVEMVREEK
ncbi:pyruvate synthase [candidate division MSBL1 archaeon SCGC-AAA382A20]|uniref:Ferredoxin n=1 Tax=candidate division MSBL1 archaeon SCGC-AAA382A20 TaxID=1698280 RepID=A0A133VIR8_9EURY|nr:pyruvate synthase [candidate division MSBL1 archaeon SCGC-AAA382A20]